MTIISTVLNWARGVALAFGAYLACTTGASILITVLYYWLLLVTTHEAWAQISLTGAAVIVGLVIGRYVYVLNRSNVPPDRNLRMATHAGFFCGWEALAALFLFTSNFTKLVLQYEDIAAVPDVILLFLLIAYLAVCVASVIVIRITARFWIP